MKTTKTITIQEAIKAGNDGQNQDIKGQFIGQHVYCNINTLAEYVLSKGYEDREVPFTFEDVENFYTLPEWSGTVLGESLFFEGGTEEAREEFLKEFERMEEESNDLLEAEEISEVTHQANLTAIEDAKKEVEDLESEPQEIFEWWAVSEFLQRKLSEAGYCVVDAGSCHIWGRTTTGQAILLDGVITRICAEMEILEGQANSWARK